MTLEMSNPTIATREGGGAGRERGGEGGKRLPTAFGRQDVVESSTHVTAPDGGLGQVRSQTALADAAALGRASSLCDASVAQYKPGRSDNLPEAAKGLMF